MTGTGIPEELRDTVSEPGETDTDGDGAGFELPLARRLARATKAEVEAVSPPGGIGARLRVRLPGPCPAQREHALSAASRTDLERSHAHSFLSYAHEDVHWMKGLREQLSSLILNPDVTVWDDSYIASGRDWDDAIHDAVLRARVAVSS